LIFLEEGNSHREYVLSKFPFDTPAGHLYCYHLEERKGNRRGDRISTSIASSSEVVGSTFNSNVGARLGLKRYVS
jgi:hypothetical protein